MGLKEFNWISDESKGLHSTYDLVSNVLLAVEETKEGKFSWSTWKDEMVGGENDGFYNSGEEDSLDFAKRAAEAASILQVSYILEELGIMESNNSDDTLVDLKL